MKRASTIIPAFTLAKRTVEAASDRVVLDHDMRHRRRIVLRTVSELVPAVPREAWIHAFPIGAYGMLKIGLMTRVALRRAVPRDQPGEVERPVLNPVTG